MFTLEVNGEQIPAHVIAHELNLLRELNLTNPEPLSEDELSKEIEKDMATRLVLRQEAQKKNYVIASSQVDAFIEELVEEHGSIEDLCEDYGVDFEDKNLLRDDVENNLKVDMLLEELSAGIAIPNENALKAYYEDHKDDFYHSEERHVKEVLQWIERDPDEIYEEMCEIRQQLLQGARIENASDDYSTEGGECDLGFISKGDLPEEYEAIVYSMNKGEISPVFQTDYGYHIATVVAINEARPMSYPDARDQIREILIYESKNDKIGEWVDQQLAKASIKRLDG